MTTSTQDCSYELDVITRTVHTLSIEGVHYLECVLPTFLGNVFLLISRRIAKQTSLTAIVQNAYHSVCLVLY